jgi:small-conductance mechanosensitive channel
MDVRHAINLEIFRRFAEEEIELPYPTQTVLVARHHSSEGPF